MSKRKNLGTAQEASAPENRGLVGYLKSNLLVVGIVAFLAIGVLGAGLKYLDEDAQRETAKRASKGYLNNEPEPMLNRVNPFLSPPDPSPTPVLSKEFLYAPGGRLLAVEDANSSAAAPADLAVWRPGTGVWYILGGSGSQQFQQNWGVGGDLPAPGDYDGDGKTDLCIFRPSANTWWILKSSDATYYSVTFGATNDKIAQADYDGDGKTDIAVFRPSDGNWYISQSSNAATVQGQFGLSTDTPTPKDFDGDGRADLAVWRSTSNTFYSSNSSNNAVQTATFTQSSTEPVPGDYDGDGKADYAIRQTGTANWLIKNSSTNQTQTISWEQSGDTAVQNDYDGDGKVDIAVWRKEESYPGASDVGRWYIRKSGSNGALRQESWGISGDIPVPAFYRR